MHKELNQEHLGSELLGLWEGSLGFLHLLSSVDDARLRCKVQLQPESHCSPGIVQPPRLLGVPTLPPHSPGRVKPLLQPEWVQMGAGGWSGEV